MLEEIDQSASGRFGVADAKAVAGIGDRDLLGTRNCLREESAILWWNDRIAIACNH